MIWDFGINVSFKDTNKQNADYDTDSLNFCNLIVIFPIGEKSNLKIEYSFRKQI